MVKRIGISNQEPITPSLTFFPGSGTVGDTIQVTVFGVPDLEIQKCVIKFNNVDATMFPTVARGYLTITFSAQVPADATSGAIELDDGDVKVLTTDLFTVL